MSCGRDIARGCVKIENTEQNEWLNKPSCTFWSCDKLSVFDWLSAIPLTHQDVDVIEVRFKNTRKGYYRNANNIELKQGDIVAVEASPGHDIGVVTLMGDLVLNQMRKNNVPNDAELKKVYRKAKPADIEKWQKAIALEHNIMLEARQIAASLRLDMKIGDVEYQGDKTKAIFYYIADERVDFRELIKVLAERFKIRVEMRQIGARQEAGRIGGIGSCGRELCCATWISNFVSVSTNAARDQELSFNPQKLAGQCGKLKCCLNYELEAYQDAQKDFPKDYEVLKTEKGTIHHIKTDIFKQLMWYSAERSSSMNTIMLTVEKVKEIVELNKQGVKVKNLVDEVAAEIQAAKTNDYANVVGQESLTRFDHNKGKKKRKRKRKKNQSKQQGSNKPQNTTNKTQGHNKEQDQTKQQGQKKRSRPQQQNKSQQQKKGQQQKRDGNKPQQKSGQPKNKQNPTNNKRKPGDRTQGNPKRRRKRQNNNNNRRPDKKN